MEPPLKTQKFGIQRAPRLVNKYPCARRVACPHSTGNRSSHTYDLCGSLSVYLFICLSSISFQFSSVAHLCPTLCDPMDCSMPGLPLHHQLSEFTQTHVYWVGDAIQPSHPLSSPFPPAFNLSQHQGLFKWVSSSHQVAKVLEFQLQNQSYQWTPRADLL